MAILRRLTIALLTVAMLATGVANAASTTNYSDQWWVPSESGWGASVLQQWDTIFIDIFVYGTDNKPTWFTGAAYYQNNSPSGHVVFTGDLYATTGPYYGGAFNPAAVTLTKVGTLTFDSDTVNTATLSYTVNGVPISKSVTRQTWRNENLSGSYYGGDSGEQTQCGADNGHWETRTFIQINHAADNSITMTWTDVDKRDDVINFTGTYSQSGHVGQIVGTATMPQAGLTASVGLFEIERTISGITGRGHMVLQSSAGSCVWDGRWGGVRR